MRLWQKSMRCESTYIIAFLDAVWLWIKTDYDDGVIYESDNVPDHKYCFEDGSLAGTGAGKGESLKFDGGYFRRILDGECGTHNDGDDATILKKVVDYCRVAPIAPQRKWALVSLRLSATQIYVPNN